MEKYIESVKEILMFAEPNAEIKVIQHTQLIDGSNKDIRLNIYGQDKITKEDIHLETYVMLGGKGLHIGINKNGKVRMFPYFGFNWTYLMAK